MPYLIEKLHKSVVTGEENRQAFYVTVQRFRVRDKDKIEDPKSS